jgi:phosphate/sulfate permease
MTGLDLALALVSAAFALNMGGSGLAPSFSAAVGAGLIGIRRAALVYGVCVIVGALTLGSRVAQTLSRGIVPESVLTPPLVLCVLGSATAALMLANLMKIPQSTSWVTVFSLVGLGLERGPLQTSVLFGKLLPTWIALPGLSFAATYAILRFFYPLALSNLRRHERLLQRPRLLRALVLASGCYVAVAIGSNNVANVAGPLSASGRLSLLPALALTSPLFGLGAWLMPGPTATVGKAIVPVGPLAAAVVSLVVGTLLFLATQLGIPQSLVQLNAAAVLAVWRVKEDAASYLDHSVARRMLLLWTVTPVLAGLLTWLATVFFVRLPGAG